MLPISNGTRNRDGAVQARVREFIKENPSASNREIQARTGASYVYVARITSQIRAAVIGSRPGLHTQRKKIVVSSPLSIRAFDTLLELAIESSTLLRRIEDGDKDGFSPEEKLERARAGLVIFSEQSALFAQRFTDIMKESPSAMTAEAKAGAGAALAAWSEVATKIGG